MLLHACYYIQNEGHDGKTGGPGYHQERNLRDIAGKTKCVLMHCGRAELMMKLIVQFDAHPALAASVEGQLASSELLHKSHLLLCVMKRIDLYLCLSLFSVPNVVFRQLLVSYQNQR